MSKSRPWHHEGVKCFKQNAFVSGTELHRLQRGKSVAGPASEAKDWI